MLGTQTLATLIAVYGLFMTPLGWGWALLVWGYALVWFLVNDRVKLLAYRAFDSPEVEPKVAARPRPAVEPEPRTAIPIPTVRRSAEVTPELARRVHELYEELGREDVRAVESWEDAERERVKNGERGANDATRLGSSARLP